MTDITHLEAHKLLQLTADAALEPGDRLAIKAHMAACPECQAYRRSLKATEHILRGSMHRRWDPQKPGLSIDKIQKHTGRSIMLKQTTITAGTLAIIAVLAFTFFAITKPSGPEPVTAAQAVLTKSPSPKVVATISVIVGPGDTCASIADKFHVSVESIIALNDRSGECILNLGETLLIPRPTSTTTPATPSANSLVLTGELNGFLPGPVGALYGDIWSPDGKQIAFIYSDTNSGSSSLGIVNADGSGLQKLADSAAAILNWSEDGSRIFFCSGQYDGGVAKAELFSIATDGTGLTNMTNGKITQALQGSCNIVSSPHGERLAFTTQVFGGGLYVMDLNGENLHELTPPNTGVYDFTWSPDGSKIIFRGQDSFNPSFASGSYLVRSDGGILDADWTVIPTNARNAESKAAFSPDGQKIVYSETDSIDPNLHALYIMDSRGVVIERLVELPGSISEIAWSPDGAQLALVAQLPEQDIYVINADGSNLRYYKNPGVLDDYPRWSPDGQKLVFVSSRIPGEDGQLILISLQDLQAYPSP